MSIHKQGLFNQFEGFSKNPYIFRTQVQSSVESIPLTPQEQEIVREQQRTIFDTDEMMKKMFHNNFEEYCEAMEHPEIMMQKIDARMMQPGKVEDIEVGFETHADLDALSFDPEESGNEISTVESFENVETGLNEMLSFEKDPLYTKAYQWSIHLHNLGHRIYDVEKRKDPDLFRVTINVFMVSAKIAYASGVDESESPIETDPAEIEISLRGYHLCALFLQRVRESLARLIQKGFTPTDEWQHALCVGDEIALGVHKRIAQLKAQNKN